MDRAPLKCTLLRWFEVGSEKPAAQQQSLPEVIATKRKEIEAAGVDFSGGICASDRPGIAAAPAAASITPAPTFYAKRHNSDGLLTIAPVSRGVVWGA